MADPRANFPRRRRPGGSAELAAAGLAVPPDCAHDCGINRDLPTLPDGEAISDHLYAASVARWHVRLRSAGDVRCHSGSRFLANACCCLLKGAGSAGQHTHCAALRGEREGQAESAEEQDFFFCFSFLFLPGPLYARAVGEVLHLAAHGPPTARQRSGSRLGALALARFGARQRRHGPHPERRAGDSALQGDGQDAPPTAGPALCRGRAQQG